MLFFSLLKITSKSFLYLTSPADVASQTTPLFIFIFLILLEGRLLLVVVKTSNHYF